MVDYPQAQKMSLTIPVNIWNDKKVNGLQKMLLALIKTLSQNGKYDIDMMTIKKSQILCTHEKDTIYNLNELHRKNFIEIYEDVLSETGYKINYKYDTVANKAAYEASKGKPKLF